jgi:hypothetical protein
MILEHPGSKAKWQIDRFPVGYRAGRNPYRSHA